MVSVHYFFEGKESPIVIDEEHPPVVGETFGWYSPIRGSEAYEVTAVHRVLHPPENGKDWSTGYFFVESKPSHRIPFS